VPLDERLACQELVLFRATEIAAEAEHLAQRDAERARAAGMLVLAVVLERREILGEVQVAAGLMCLYMWTTRPSVRRRQPIHMNCQAGTMHDEPRGARHRCRESG